MRLLKFLKQLWMFRCWSDTCFCVSSPVTDEFESREHGAFIVIRIEPELGLCIVTVLHEWNLSTQRYWDTIKTRSQWFSDATYLTQRWLVQLNFYMSQSRKQVTTCDYHGVASWLLGCCYSLARALPAFLMGR